MKKILPILFLLILSSCNPPTKQFQFPSVEKPDRTWNVAFLIMDHVFNSELTAPMDILHHTRFHNEHGMNVFTVANSTQPLVTFEGLKIIPDYNYLTDSLPHIDVLVVPSAEHHLDTDLEDKAMLRFVKETGDKANYVLSLCDGAFVLAESGLLQRIESTTFPGDIEAYQKRYPSLTVHKDVLYVHDGKFITSAGGAKSFEPALYLAEMLYGKKAADGIAKGMVIDWDVSKVPGVVVK